MPLIVAELGMNTNGSLDQALRMVEKAAWAGVDGIKVQCYETGDFLPEGHPDWELFESNRLRWDDIEAVFAFCRGVGLKYGGTPTSLDGIEFLAEQNVDWLKNGSDYLLRDDMIDAMIDTGIDVWVATGMATPGEIARIKDVYLMACTSLYPCPLEHANVARLKWAHGYSDHTVGFTAACAATVLGAKMIEKHFTLNHLLPGPDHVFSANPHEMMQLTHAVRKTETALGTWAPKLTPEEEGNRRRWRVTEGVLRP